jgi:hypothetical protein
MRAPSVIGLHLDTRRAGKARNRQWPCCSHGSATGSAVLWYGKGTFSRGGGVFTRQLARRPGRGAVSGPPLRIPQHKTEHRGPVSRDSPAIHRCKNAPQKPFIVARMIAHVLQSLGRPQMRLDPPHLPVRRVSTSTTKRRNKNSF